MINNIKKFWYCFGEVFIVILIYIIYIIGIIFLICFVDYKISKDKIKDCINKNGKPTIYNYAEYDSFRGCTYNKLEKDGDKFD